MPRLRVKRSGTGIGAGEALALPLLIIAMVASAACDFSGDVQVGPADANPPTDAGADAGPPVCGAGDLNLVLCMRFEHENGVTSLLDESQYGNHASALNATFADGTDMQALVTDAEFESQIDESPSLDLVREISMEMWVKPADSVGAIQMLFHNAEQWAMYLNMNNTFGCNLGNGGAVSSLGGVILAGSWQHLACVYDGVTIQLYLNGKSVAETDFAGDLLTDGGAGSCVALGCAGDNHYLGQIDTLRVWSRALGQQDLCESAKLTDEQCADILADPL